MSAPVSDWARVGEEMLFDWRDLIPGLDGRAQLLFDLGFPEVYKLWVEIGKPVLSDYHLDWVIIPPDDDQNGIAIINDFHGSKKFQIYADYTHFSKDGCHKLFWQMIACVIADEVGVIRSHCYVV